jgi:RnfABCDGE-type electron transport complex G subunit
MILWAMGGITFEIPLATIVTFLAFIALFGGQGFDPLFLLAHLAGGGVIMAAFFMATDPVTSPVTSTGQLLYGAMVGILSGIFRVYGSAADSVSYAVIISNLVVPLIDEISVPVPFGNRTQKESGGKKGIPKPAITLCVITLIAGVALSGVYALTKDSIEQQQMAANAAAYAEVCPQAENFGYDDTINAAVDALGGEVYGTDFGKAYINEVVVGTDASGTVVGYVISATSGDGYAGNITIAVGIAADGTVNGISFTELNETAGMGMLCAEPAFKDQFNGVNTDQFVLNKSGGSTADNEIDSVSGASTSSGAVVNAVNAALDFFAANMK